VDCATIAGPPEQQRGGKPRLAIPMGLGPVQLTDHGVCSGERGFSTAAPLCQPPNQLGIQQRTGTLDARGWHGLTSCSPLTGGFLASAPPSPVAAVRGAWLLPLSQPTAAAA
jgi:hypothetical protein